MDTFEAIISKPHNSKFGRGGTVVEVVGVLLRADHGTKLEVSSLSALNRAFGDELEISRTADSRGVKVIWRFVACSRKKVQVESQALARAFRQHLGMQAVVQ
jgi:hypothetical protein